MELYNQYATSFLLLLVGGIVGYVIGRLDVACSHPVQPASSWLTDGKAREPERTAPVVTAPANQISIDDRTFVSKISTASMAKTQPVSLGKTTETQDDITSSISKLAQLKGK